MKRSQPLTGTQQSGGYINNTRSGTSLVVQLLALCTFTAMAWVQSLVRELRFQKLCGMPLPPAPKKTNTIQVQHLRVTPTRGPTVWWCHLSPLYASMLKWKVKVRIAPSCLTLCNPMDYTVYGILQARILEWVAFPFSKGSSQPRDWTQVSNIAGGCFTSWVTGKAKNTGVDSWSLLQQIFQTQESNQGLLHCRQILYQLSYQGRHVTEYDV